MSSLFARMIALNTPGAYSAPASKPDTAPPGRQTPVLPQPEPHTVLKTSLTDPILPNEESLVMGIGCFWGAEKLFWTMPGVVSTSVGYAGGYTPNPTYEEVCSGTTGHTEVIRVVWDPEQVTLEQIMARALENHNPTQGDRQGNDIGSQYRSVMYATDEQQKETIQKIVDSYGQKLQENGYGPITTEVKLLEETPLQQMYLAEDYHQQYLDKNPGGYCPSHATGVTCG